MRFYTGNQWQDNALAGIGSFVPAASTIGQYCTLTAGNPAVVFAPAGGLNSQSYISQFGMISTTFYIFANAGVSGGTIQPQVQFADGNYRDYGLSVPLSAPGFVTSVIINTPILGARFNITIAVTGGTVYL